MNDSTRRVSDRGRISVNAGYQLIAQAAVLGLNLVASPIIVHGLGLEAYGLLILVGVTTNYFGFVEMGLGRAAVQLLARHRARGEQEDFVQVLWTATVAYLALGVVGAAVLVAIAPLLVRHVLNVSAGLQTQAIQAFAIGAVGLVIALQRNVASSVATAMERFDLISRVTLVLGALQAVLTVGLVMMGTRLIGVMLGGLAVQTAGFLVYLAISRHLLPNLLPVRWTVARLRTIARLGGYISVSQIVNPVLEQIEKVLIGAFAAVDQLPYYSVPYSVAWALTVVPTSLASVIYPAMARLLSQEDHAGVRETVRRATRYIFVMLLGPVVFLILYARPLLAVWMGPDFAARASIPLRILSLAVLVNVLSWPAYHLLHAAGRADLTARYHLLELVLHVPVTILLISRLGVIGAALAWLLRVGFDSTLMLRAAARVTGVRIRAIAASLAWGALPALLLLPLAMIARHWVDASHRVEGALALVTVGALYAAPVVWLGLGREERSVVVGSIRALVTGDGRTV
jgi:O-antigen/teichoic acid export membrane protein